MSLPTSKSRKTTDRERLDHLATEIQHREWWDAIALTGPNAPALTYSQRLFGNANVGNQYLTNLQVGGMLAHGSDSVLLRRWYLRTNFAVDVTPQYAAAWSAFMNGLAATLVVGNRPTWSANGAQLYRNASHPNDVNWPLVIPPHEHVYVNIDRYTEAYSGFRQQLDALLGEAGQAAMAMDPPVFAQIWIHLVGLRVPGELAEAVARKLTELEGQRKSVEQRVVDWLQRTAETADDAGKVQLEAICDGILEGRHMGGV